MLTLYYVVDLIVLIRKQRVLFGLLGNKLMENLEWVEKVGVVLGCVYLSRKIIGQMWSLLNIEKEPVTVLVTGAAGMFIQLICWIKLLHYVLTFFSHCFGCWLSEI